MKVFVVMANDFPVRRRRARLGATPDANLLRTARADLFVVDWSPSESRYLDREDQEWPSVAPDTRGYENARR